MFYIQDSEDPFSWPEDSVATHYGWPHLTAEEAQVVSEKPCVQLTLANINQGRKGEWI